MTRYLIVNADDFGQSFGINRGIITAFEHGIVTSASLMVRWPAAREAAEYARAHSSLSIGLHFDLGEWSYEDGNWRPNYRVLDEESEEAVRDEASSQIAEFIQLMGKPPTHIDSHQHVHREEPGLTVLRQIAASLGVPLRDQAPGITYCGDFYGQTSEGYPMPSYVGLPHLEGVLRSLLPGFTELGCHPGLADDLDSMYRSERELELKTLCNPRVRELLTEESIALCSFVDFIFLRVLHRGRRKKSRHFGKYDRWTNWMRDAYENSCHRRSWLYRQPPD